MNIQKSDIENLRNCKTDDEIESFFSAREVSGYEEKSAFLKAAAGEIETYYVGGSEDLSPELKYEDDKFLFLERTWSAFL